MAISTDFTPTLAHWKKELNVSYPMLSDHMRKVSELYGVLIPEMGIANRVTFIVDTDGKIVDIQEGNAALANSHRFIHAAMALEAGLNPSAHPDEFFKTFSHDLELTLYFLAAGLRGSKVAPDSLPNLRDDHNRLNHSETAMIIEADRMTNSLNTLAYADVPAAQMSSATSLAQLAQQFGQAIGIALSALMLQTLMTWRGEPHLSRYDFQVTFILIALLTLGSLPGFLRLPKNVGEEISGRKAVNSVS